LLGDILLQKIEDSSEVFAGGADTKEDGTEEVSRHIFNQRFIFRDSKKLQETCSLMKTTLR
jgi:hypothetical protein